MGSLHTASKRWKLGFALALTTAILWGSLPVALRSLLTTMEPGTVVWYRFSFSAIVLGLILFWKRVLPAPLPRGGAVWTLLATAAIGFAANNVLFVKALGYITPTAAQLVLQLAPLLLLAGAVVLFRERFHALQGIGILVLCCGVGVFFRDRVQELFGGMNTYAIGVMLTLLAAAVWAAYALAQKQLLLHYQSPVVMWVIYAAGAVILLPMANLSQIFLLSKAQFIALAYCATLTILGYGAFAEALAHWDASRVSAVIALTPLLTWAFNHIASMIAPGFAQAEGISALSLVGAGLAATGSAVIALAKRK